MPLKSGVARVYPRSDIILGRDLTEEEARASSVWLDFAVGYQSRLDKYVENTFRFGKDKYKYDKMMGIFVPADDQPIERVVVFSRINSRSQAFGGYHLDNCARLVGVRNKTYNDLFSLLKSGLSPDSLRLQKEGDKILDLEVFLSEQGISREELYQAVELYKKFKLR